MCLERARRLSNQILSDAVSFGNLVCGMRGTVRGFKIAELIAVQVQFKKTAHHGDRLGPVARFVLSVAQRCAAIDKQTTASMRPVLDNPVTATILADKKLRSPLITVWSCMIQLAHGTSPYAQILGIAGLSLHRGPAWRSIADPARACSGVPAGKNRSTRC